MFRETVTHAGGDSQGAANESHALMLMRRALNRGYAMEATTAGGVVIRWTHFTLTTGPTAVRSIKLTPLYPLDHFDEATRALLATAGKNGARYEVHHDRRVIAVDGREISPTDTARLRARRLVAVDGAGRVRLTMASLLSLLAHAHTQTGHLAECSCGFTPNAPAGEAADTALRGHRQAMTAQFTDSITATYAAALTDRR